MSFFEDELKRLAPGISGGCTAVLEKTYGNCVGFHTGLDVMAKILNSGQISKQTPAFGEPWSSIYSDTVQIFQAKGCLLMEAFEEALMMGSRPALPLHDAVSFRINAIAQQQAKGGGKTSADYLSALSMLGYDVRYNLAGRKKEINGEPISDNLESTIRWKMKDAGYKGKENISDTISMAAAQNEYHPVREYLSGLQWDGVTRIRDLAGFFEAVYAPIWPVVLRKWLIGAVDRVMTSAESPILHAGCVLCSVSSGKALSIRQIVMIRSQLRKLGSGKSLSSAQQRAKRTGKR